MSAEGIRDRRQAARQGGEGVAAAVWSGDMKKPKPFATEVELCAAVRDADAETWMPKVRV